MPTILIVDDSASNRAVLVLLLGHHGHRMLEAADGAEALAVVGSERPDLIIADILMPTMDGYEFVRRLRADPAIATTPVLYCTAHYHEREAQNLARAWGVASVLTKPCEPEAVLRAVHAVLGISPPSPAMDAAADVAFDREHLRIVTDKLSEKVSLLRTANAHLSALVELSLSLGSEYDPQRLLEEFCRAVREMVGASFALVGIPNGNGRRLRHHLTSGMDPAVAGQLDAPNPRQGVLATVMNERRSCRVQNPCGDPADLGLPPSFPPCRSFLGAPIASPRRVHGWLCLFDKLGADEFSAEDERLAGILAAQVGRIYENASLYADALRHAADLELEVGERKRAEEQLRHSQKMEAIGRLAGGVAHDFNNLLTVINGYGELLLSRVSADDPMREFIRPIVQAGDRAAALTRQLLAFSRKTMVEPRVLDPRTVIATVEAMLRRVLGEDIQLATVAGTDVGFVKADPGYVEQVVINLAVNARDAMPQGGRLTIEVRNAELDETYTSKHADARPGPHVMLAVSDTGCGMSADTLARIFEPFFTTKGEGGTGLGLATVYGIVKQSGGHLAVYSEPGHGTTFKAYLPRVENPSNGRTSHPGPTAMPRGTATVFLVEDEDGVRALGRQVLASCGYTVLEAANGADALLLATEHAGPIDLLVTDVIMPRMGGRELAERLTAMRPGLQVLFVSGYTDDAVVRHGILAAEVAFLQKPFSPAALAAKVRDVIEG